MKHVKSFRNFSLNERVGVQSMSKIDSVFEDFKKSVLNTCREEGYDVTMEMVDGFVNEIKPIVKNRVSMMSISDLKFLKKEIADLLNIEPSELGSLTYDDCLSFLHSSYKGSVPVSSMYESKESSSDEMKEMLGNLRGQLGSQFGDMKNKITSSVMGFAKKAVGILVLIGMSIGCLSFIPMAAKYMNLPIWEVLKFDLFALFMMVIAIFIIPGFGFWMLGSGSSSGSNKKKKSKKVTEEEEEEEEE